jgi:hypothetical protein
MVGYFQVLPNVRVGQALVVSSGYPVWLSWSK